MMRWEYRQEVMPIPAAGQLLNVLGLEGWETQAMFQVMAQASPFATHQEPGLMVILKRPFVGKNSPNLIGN